MTTKVRPLALVASGVLTLALGAVAGPGQAQVVSQTCDAPAAAQPTPVPDATAVSEIVVTATSIATIGDQPVIETPRTVQALNANLIQNVQPTSFQEVAKLIPALTPESPYSTPENRYFIRGSDPDTRRDGLSIRYTFLPLEEIDRYEVLQGVTDVTQGGEKPPGGAINVVPKHALATNLAEFTAGVNEYGGAVGRADVNVPFDDGRYGLRTNIGLEHIDLPNGMDGSRYAAAVAFRAYLTPKLILDVNGHYQDQRQNDETYGYFGLVTNPDGSSSLPRGLSYDRSYGEPWATTHWRVGTVEAKLSGDLGGGWSLVAAVQLSRLSNDQLHAFPFEIAPNGDTTVLAQSDRSRVQDDAARVAVSKTFEFGPNVTDKVAVVGTYLVDRLSGYFVNTFADQTANLYGNFTIPRPDIVLPSSQPENGEIVKTLGVADELTLFKRLTLQAGVTRYDLKQKNYDGDGNVSGETGLQIWLPNASALFRLDPRWTVYATYTRSAQSGGTVGGTYANAGDQLPAIQADTYEVGSKYQLGGLLLTAAAYTYSVPAPFVNSQNVQTISGSTRYRGLDFQAAGKVTSRLSVIGGIAVIDAKVLSADDPTAVDKQPVNVPKLSVSLYAEYRLVGGLYLTGGAFHVARKPAVSDDSVYVPSYSTFDLGARYETRIADKKTTFRLDATNLANTFYFAGGNFGFPQIGTPRFVKASVTFDY